MANAFFSFGSTAQYHRLPLSLCGPLISEAVWCSLACSLRGSSYYVSMEWVLTVKNGAPLWMQIKYDEEWNTCMICAVSVSMYPNGTWMLLLNLPLLALKHWNAVKRTYVRASQHHPTLSIDGPCFIAIYREHSLLGFNYVHPKFYVTGFTCQFVLPSWMWEGNGTEP